MISYCAEETRNPGRDVPIAITTSLAFVGLLYILLATSELRERGGGKDMSHITFVG